MSWSLVRAISLVSSFQSVAARMNGGKFEQISLDKRNANFVRVIMTRENERGRYDVSLTKFGSAISKVYGNETASRGTSYDTAAINRWNLYAVRHLQASIILV